MNIYELNVLLILIFIFTGCNAQPNSQKKTIFEKHDSNGLLVERWGNEKTWDNDVNFREFFYYDDNGNIIKTIYYPFSRENTECLIPDFDKERYIETRYEYEDGKLKMEKKYNPVLNDQNEVIGHELYYTFNHFTKEEKTY